MFFLKFEFFLNHHLTRHYKYKVTNLAPRNMSMMPNKIPLTNLERLLRRIKSPLTRL